MILAVAITTMLELVCWSTQLIVLKPQFLQTLLQFYSSLVFNEESITAQLLDKFKIKTIWTNCRQLDSINTNSSIYINC